MNKSLIITLIVVASAVAGCTMAPRYQRPQAPVPKTWPQGPAYTCATTQSTTAPAAASITWQEFFQDPKLRRVIDIALQNNRDLRVAALNIERARALYDIQRAELLPVIDADASFIRQRLPADLSRVGRPLTVNQFGANVFLSAWEIDFFGRIQSLVERSLQEYLATQQAQRSAQILLISELANAYLTLAADRETLQIADTTLQCQQAAYNLVKKRLEGGIVPELDLHRAQTQVDTARVDVAHLTQLVAQDRNALDLLAGSPVADQLLPAELASVLPIPQLSAGLSSEVLLQRPDIMQAEDQLKAANANIGAARAAFFPRISLTSAIGTGSNELSGLFKAGSMAWTVGPQVVVPVFDPRTWSTLRVTEVEQRTAVAQYEKAIQTAFREVSDTLAVVGTADQQIAAQQSLVNASSETYRLAAVRYAKGVDSYLSVLDAQQSLYAAQQRLVAMRLGKLANQVRLYAVLGGGSNSNSAPSTTASRMPAPDHKN